MKAYCSACVRETDHDLESASVVHDTRLLDHPYRATIRVCCARCRHTHTEEVFAKDARWSGQGIILEV